MGGLLSQNGRLWPIFIHCKSFAPSTFSRLSVQFNPHRPSTLRQDRFLWTGSIKQIPVKKYLSGKCPRYKILKTGFLFNKIWVSVA